MGEALRMPNIWQPNLWDGFTKIALPFRPLPLEQMALFSQPRATIMAFSTSLRDNFTPLDIQGM
jgi:hypothetical protein